LPGIAEKIHFQMAFYKQLWDIASKNKL
jgi:hypothetical protein